MDGIELARRYWADVAEPMVREVRVPVAASLVGTGSEVLGFDDARSADHSWPPPVRILLDDADAHRAVVLAGRLDRDRAVVFPLGDFLRTQLGFDPRDGITSADWLTTSTQRLLEVTAGAVFQDDIGFGAVRAALAWYPDDVWRYVLASQWLRISQEEPFVGRTAEVGDDLGSRLLAGRLARDTMRLWFLLERRYPPYAKWFGSAFARLDPPAELVASLETAVTTADGDERQQALARGYELAGERTNHLGLAPPVEATRRPFHDRPFTVIHGERFTDALRQSITDPALRSVPAVGSADQFLDSTDVLAHADRCRAATLAALS